MYINERDNRKERVIHVAQQLMTAARTAPKARGVDILEIVLLTDEQIVDLAQKMELFYQEHHQEFFLRDAKNVQQSEAVLLIGTSAKNMGLNCGYCGFKTCAEKEEHIPCSINTIDVGIAIGSVVALAADLRIDCRVMYSAGCTALKYKFLPDCKTIFAIPLSISSKNLFFDRK